MDWNFFFPLFWIGCAVCGAGAYFEFGEKRHYFFIVGGTLIGAFILTGTWS